MVEEQIQPTIDSLKELIGFTLELRMQFKGSEDGLKAEQPYAAFAELIRDLQAGSPFSVEQTCQAVSVITFNYDVALDVAIQNCGYAVNYHISAPGRAASTVDVLKLHGSLNWALTFPGEGDGGNRIEPLSMAEFLNIAPAAWKNIGQHRCDIVSRLSEFFLNYKRKRVMPTPVIVPPTWNKADYHSALSSVWAAAADHLAQAEHVIVIGYSLPETDAFFRHLWALGSVGEHPLQSFFVLNKAPKGGSVDRRFKRLLGHDALARYQYIHGEFNEFAVGTIRQYLQKDVTREKMIENFRMAEPPR